MESETGQSGPGSNLMSSSLAEKVIEAERRLRLAFQSYRHISPPSIWQCCSRRCFAMVAGDPTLLGLLEQVIGIRQIAEGYHEEIENVSRHVQLRRKEIDGINVNYSAPSRFEREGGSQLTDRGRAVQRLANCSVEELPFLYAQKGAPNGTAHPVRNFCSEAICCILGVSRNFLYRRNIAFSRIVSSDQDLTSVVDTACVRQRQYRLLEVGEDVLILKISRGTTVTAEISVLMEFQLGGCKMSTKSSPFWLRE